MGLFDILKAAVIPAADARAGYLEGQSEEADKQTAVDRQARLDQAKAALDQSTMTENASRGRYYDAFASQKDTPAENWAPLPNADTPTIFNKTSGEIQSGVAMAKTKPENVKDVNVYDPSTGSVSDVTVSGKRVNTRAATMLERLHYARTARDPNQGPAMNDSEREALANRLADRAVAAAQGDPVKAQAIMMQPTEYPKAVSAGMTRAHYYAAARRYRRQASIDADMHDIGPDGSPTTTAGTPGAPPAPGTTPRVTRPSATPTSPNGTDLSDDQILDAMDHGASSPDDVVSYWKRKGGGE